MSHLDRITFGTDGWRDQTEAFTEERVTAVCEAFLGYLIDHGHTDAPIAIGYDARRDSRTIAETLATCATTIGYEVWFAMRDCPTPAVAATIDAYELAGGFMVTASHNPPTYNGIKLIPTGGAPALPTVTDSVESRLGRPSEPIASVRGEQIEFDYVDEHIETVLDRLDLDLQGMHIAYDAMFGSGRGVTDAILEEFGATVTRLRCEYREDFDGLAPEPTKQALGTLTDLVKSEAIDLGVATDGDADRVAVVTSQGFVDANSLFAVMYDHLLQSASGPAVRTVSTTYLIDRIAHAHDEAVIETPVGFKWVAQAMAEHDALIGGEDSGGFSIHGHVREKDGPLASALAAAAHNVQSIDSRIRELHELYGEIHHAKASVDCPEAEKDRVLAALTADKPDEVTGITITSINESDGLKFQLKDGSWLLIRPSGTEPKIRIYAESDSVEHADLLVHAGENFLQSIL